VVAEFAGECYRPSRPCCSSLLVGDPCLMTLIRSRVLLADMGIRNGPAGGLTRLREGHEWSPGKVIVSWVPCPCAGGRGHQSVSCTAGGCRETWYDPPHAAGADLRGPEGEVARYGQREAWHPVN
jgi:hypothetical protein